jgi:hypothetical protein
MKGYIIKIYLLEDRFVTILFRLFKFGIIRTKSDENNGMSIVFGIYKLEFQFNISIIKAKTIKILKHGIGNA